MESRAAEVTPKPAVPDEPALAPPRGRPSAAGIEHMFELHSRQLKEREELALIKLRTDHKLHETYMAALSRHPK